MKDQATGCGVLFVICIALAVALVLAAGWSNDKAAKYERARGQAESMVIRAQAESRLTAAIASAITTASITPVIVFGGLLIFGLTTIGAIVMVIVKILDTRPAIIHTQPQIIERQTIYLPSPDMTRREVWQALSDSKPDVLVLPAKVKSEVTK